MNAKTQTVRKQTATKGSNVPAEYIVRRLGEDVRNSVLVVSLLVNAFLLIGWLVIEVSSRYDAALINYIQNQ